MRTPPQIRMLPDGRRMHLHDGPIDLVIEAFGAADAVRPAYQAAATRFRSLLDELCDELPLLRMRAHLERCLLQGPVARRMHAAVAPFAAGSFITPMAAVAGSVAEEILDTMTAAANLTKAYVNNGGDIALHLSTAAECFSIGLADRPDRPSLFGKAVLSSADGVGGIATSGWRGRSFSLGIADAVTILAAQASVADAAATIVANAVDLPGHASVVRVPAQELQPDSDLGRRLVTRDVGSLDPAEIQEALGRGVSCAKRLLAAGLIQAAALHLQGETRVIGLSANHPESEERVLAHA
jgi:ApbE superfamily uncharacterized protein (UPF0280 family)